MVDLVLEGEDVLNGTKASVKLMENGAVLRHILVTTKMQKGADGKDYPAIVFEFAETDSPPKKPEVRKPKLSVVH